MSNIIHLLPDAIANQIAAGEVVQRPASIIKELLENSIDAESSKITVIIKDAGKQLIQIIDNGNGMNTNDARMCFEPHATSKIKNSEDLFNIHTLGFRGEALASIASIAQVTLKTRTEEMEMGTNVQIEGGKFKNQSPCSINRGGHFLVKNIFYNVPARRKFLKSNTVEMRHIYDEFLRIALANPNTELNLIVEDKDIYQLNSSKLPIRISKIFGDKYKNNILKINEDTGYISLKGYIGTPDIAKKTKGEQFFFVNGRYIKSYALQTAVNQAYHGLLDDKKNPFFALFIGINPKSIDINVHPTKTEIKFQDAQSIFSIIKSCVKQALGQYHISPSINFDANVNWKNELDNIPKNIEISDNKNVNHPSNNTSHNHNYNKNQNSPNKIPNLKNWQKLYEENIENSVNKAINEFEQESKKDVNLPTLSPSDIPNILPKDTEKERVIFSSTIQPNLQQHNIDVQSNDTGIGYFIQMTGGLILFAIPSGVLVFNQKKAVERILFEKHLQLLSKKSSASQRYLFPITLNFSIEDMLLLKGIWTEIENIGFIIESFGKNDILLHGGPAHLHEVPEKELFEGMIAQYKLEEDTVNEDELKNILDINTRKEAFKIAKALAKKGSVSNTKKLEIKEISSIINQLFACKFPNISLDGNPIFKILTPEVFNALIIQD